MHGETSGTIRTMQISRRSAAAAAFALLGLSVGVATADFGSGEITVTGAPFATARPAGAVPQKELAARLDDVREALDLRPDQEEGWWRYADVVFALDRERRDFDRRVASGELRDDGTEYWRHYVVLNEAVENLKGILSARQVASFRPMTESLICGGLARN
jgi:hypothetical protein